MPKCPSCERSDEVKNIDSALDYIKWKAHSAITGITLTPTIDPPPGVQTANEVITKPRHYCTRCKLFFR